LLKKANELGLVGLFIREESGGPYGAKKASEGAIVSAPPSIVSAIHSATGMWSKEVPVTLEKIAMVLRG
jgi:CO/xanthine dehydrogenase Mo-binding subunit